MTPRGSAGLTRSDLLRRAVEHLAEGWLPPLPEPMARHELLEVLSAKARGGHIGAIRLLLRELEKQPAQPDAYAPFEELG